MDTFNELLHSSTPVLVEFLTEWCKPCQQMAAVLEQVKEQQESPLHVTYIDIDQYPQMATYYSIQTIPTLILFKSGKQRWRQNGIMEAQALDVIIRMLLQRMAHED